MARAPNEKQVKAKKLFDKGYKLIDISKELDIPEGTIRSWKNRYNWNNDNNATLQKEEKKKRNVANEKGKGKFSKINKLETMQIKQPSKARQNNKNAVSTHEFEKILFDTLEDEEKELVEQTPFEKMKLLKQEIQLYTVRERRMLQRIAKLKEKELVIDSATSGINGEFDIDTTQSIAAINRIQNIEEALTRVQEKKQKAIDSLHKYQIDDAKLELLEKQADDLDEDIEYIIEDDADEEKKN